MAASFFFLFVAFVLSNFLLYRRPQTVAQIPMDRRFPRDRYIR